MTPCDPEGISPAALELLSGEARSRTWQAVHDIAAQIVPGMTEKQAIARANRIFAERGVRKFWHRTHIRFGQSTIRSFDDPYEDDTTLQHNDIFYIDVGPIWSLPGTGDIEGDAGKTFVVGEKPEGEKIVCDVEALFAEIRTYWTQTRPTGTALLAYAKEKTEAMGYLLHPSYVKGHRLSEFPHRIYSTNTLFEFNRVPAPARWVLELQICRRDLAFGAFFEDLLV